MVKPRPKDAKYFNTDGIVTYRVEAKPEIEEEADAGRRYHLDHYWLDVAADDETVLLVRTNGNIIKLGYLINYGGSCEAQFFENPDVSADGTEATIYNVNRISTATTETQIFYDSTYDDTTGDRIAHTYLAGGTGPFRRGANTLLSRWRPKLNSDYIISVYNRSGGPINISITVEFTVLQ